VAVTTPVRIREGTFYNVSCLMGINKVIYAACILDARLAQLVERKTLNLVVVGSSPTVGTSKYFSLFCLCAIAECSLQL
jgi:hypothetical protein